MLLKSLGLFLLIVTKRYILFIFVSVNSNIKIFYFRYKSGVLHFSVYGLYGRNKNRSYKLFNKSTNSGISSMIVVAPAFFISSTFPKP